MPPGISGKETAEASNVEDCETTEKLDGPERCQLQGILHEERMQSEDVESSQNELLDCSQKSLPDEELNAHSVVIQRWIPCSISPISTGLKKNGSHVFQFLLQRNFLKSLLMIRSVRGPIVT